jgi:hypothetical protein
LFCSMVSEVVVFVVGWFYCFGAEARHDTMAIGACARGGCSPHSSQERERERDRER